MYLEQQPGNPGDPNGQAARAGRSAHTAQLLSTVGHAHIGKGRDKQHSRHEYADLFEKPIGTAMVLLVWQDNFIGVAR